jgi:hypothetical protein
LAPIQDIGIKHVLGAGVITARLQIRNLQVEAAGRAPSVKQRRELLAVLAGAPQPARLPDAPEILWP